MAYVDIPLMNPVAFYEKGFTNDARYNFPHIDDYLNREQAQEWQFSREYFQKWQTNDTIKLQVLSNISPVSVAMYRWNNYGTPILPTTGTVMTTTLLAPGFDVYEMSIPLTGLSDDTYYLELTVGSKVFISEPMWIKPKHEGTILYEYTNDENDHDVIFKRVVSGNISYLSFSFRAEAFIEEFWPLSQSTLYKDHNLNNVVLKSTPYRQFKMFVGQAEGVPNWVIDRINRAFDCTTVTLDGKGFSRTESGKFEPQRMKMYPHAAWTMDIIETKNRFSKRYDPGGTSGGLSIVYNIDGRAFGAQNDLAGNNIIQVTSTTD